MTTRNAIPLTAERASKLLRDQGYFFRYAAVATLIIGIYLHITSLIIGRELFLQYVLTPTFDRVLAVPMIYAALSGWLAWRYTLRWAAWHRIVYGFLVIYFTISVPIHARTFITGSIEPVIRLFPEGYSYFILPIMLVLLSYAWQLHFQPNN